MPKPSLIEVGLETVVQTAIDLKHHIRLIVRWIRMEFIPQRMETHLSFSRSLIRDTATRLAHWESLAAQSPQQDPAPPQIAWPFERYTRRSTEERRAAVVCVSRVLTLLAAESRQTHGDGLELLGTALVASIDVRY